MPTPKLTSLLLASGLVAGCGSFPVAPKPAAVLSVAIQGHPPHDVRRLMDVGGVGSTWNLQQIQDNGYRVQSTSGPRVVVAVLDTGVDPGQPQLQAHTYPLIDMVGRDIYSAAGRNIDFTGVDGNGHGTHVAGIVEAVAAGANVSVLPVKVIPNGGIGDDVLLSNGIDKAIAWHDPTDPTVGVRIMNLSVSSPSTSERLSAAIKRATAAGILVVCAAGNEGGAVDFPATLPNVLTVGATDVNDEVAEYSCFGPQIDLVAPGGDEDMPVYSTWPRYLTSDDLDAGVSTPHDEAGLVGTSMATPHASALAAVCWTLHPYMSAKQVRAALLAMSDDLGALGPDNHYGFGRLNFARVTQNSANDAH